MEAERLEDALEGRRRIASYATERDYAPFARAMLWKLGYAVLPPEEIASPELRVVREGRLGEVTQLPLRPLILLTDRRQAETGDARVTGTVRRPAGVPALYRLFQAALEEHPRSVPRAPASLPARGTSGAGQAFDLVVRSLSENGCLLAGPKLPFLETPLDLVIEFPWGEKLQLAALVAYEQAGNVGALFQQLTPALRLRLGKLVARLLELY
jgi:PilZ domain